MAGPSLAADRVRRAEAPDCAAQLSTYGRCQTEAAKLLTGIKADGKPDLMERKTCNMIEAMEKCEEEMTDNCREPMKKHTHEQMIKMINKVKKELVHWDSNKCPAAMYYLNGAGSLQLGLAAIIVAILSFKL